jgi:carboxyl-terminal processing protease
VSKSTQGKRNIWIVVLIVISFSLGIFFGRQVDAPSLDTLLTAKSKVDLDLFWEVWRVMDSKYVEKDKVTDEEKMYGAIKGMVDSYGDPATVFLTPKETEEFEDMSSGKYFEGIGAELGYRDGAIVVVSPLDGSPAKAAGVKAGDYILAVDDYEVKSGDNIYSIVDKIRGEAGTVVLLKVLHLNELKPVEIEIVRGEITVPSMTLSFIGPNKSIALIDIARFTEASYLIWSENWNNVVDEVVQSGVKKIIIDLRSNPGGFFDAAVYAAEDFLASDTLIAQQQDGKGKVQDFLSKKDGRLKGKEVVVLVDMGSASASEIFAGALQQNKVAKILGTETYGKGTAQNILELYGGSSLHITTLKWLLPDGKWLNRENPVVPDIEVENSNEDFLKGFDRQLDEAIKLLSK